MSRSLTGGRELPAWVSPVAGALPDTVDPGTLQRGRGYADAGMVLNLSVVGEDKGLFAAVRGTRRQPYHVLIQVRHAPRMVSWTSTCTCPMGGDCKHVVAVVLAAERESSASGPAPDIRAAPPWRSVLGPVAGPPSGSDDDVPLALALEWDGTDPRPSAGQRVLLRPLRRGARDRWVRSGATWNQMSHPGPDRGTQRARAAMSAIHRVAQAERAGRQPGLWYHYGSATETVHLDDIGVQAVGLLRAAARAGVTLLTGRHGQRVRVCAEPARVRLDLRIGQDGQLLLEPLLRYGEETTAMTQVTLIGSPPSIMLRAEEPHVLTLAGLELPDIDVAPILDAGSVSVPAAEIGQFASGYFPVLSRHVEVGSTDGSYELPQPPSPRVRLEAAYGQRHGLTLTWEITYGTGADATRLPLRGAEPVRDRDAEAGVLRRCAQAVGLHLPQAITHDPVSGAAPASPIRLQGMETATFTAQVLPGLEEDADVDVVVIGDPADYRPSEEAPLVKVAVAQAEDGHTDWFDLDVSVEVGGESVPFRPLFTALAAGDRQLLLDSGTWFGLDRPELDALRRLIEEARAVQDDDGPLRLTRWQAGIWDELTDIAAVSAQCEAWRNAVAGLLDSGAREPYAPATGLRATLRPYQLDGYRWLSYLSEHRLGGVLADDMGLGKTLQALATVLRTKEAGELTRPVLVVAPTSVIATWVAEAARFTPDLTVTAVTETLARRRLPLARLASQSDVVVTSYAIVRLEADEFLAQPWGSVYLDEAQAVKNPHAKTHQVVRRLDAPVKIAITGTPLENSLTDLWALLAISAPGLFPRLSSFADVYRKPIESGTDPERLQRLQRRVRPLMLRRTKEAVAPELPPKQEQLLPIELAPAHRRVYDRHLARERQRVLGMLEDFQRNRIAIFRALTKLRQLALAPGLVDAAHAGVPSTKVEVFAEQIAEVASEGHRALVFSQFTGFLRLVWERLDRDRIGYCYLDGRTRDRPRRIEQFRRGDAPAFLISLKAGGFGLTLTEADYVFLLDPWWNPAVEQQAIDRTHRIGQDKTVMVYRMIATETIEEKVVALQQRKRDLFARVVDDGGSIDGALTPEDIRGLLQA